MPTPEQKAAYKAALNAAQKTVAAALPQGMDAIRLCAVFVACADAAPTLYECSAASIQVAFVKVAYAGLYPSPAGGRGEIWLIPRRQKGAQEMQVQGGYKGLCALAYRAGFVRALSASAVYSNEPELAAPPNPGQHPVGIFVGSEPWTLYHRRALSWSAPNEPPIGAFAVAHLQGGGIVGTWLPRSELVRRAVIGRSVTADGKGWLSGDSDRAWIAHPGDMARKCALADMLNSGTVPLSPDVSPLVHEIARDALGILDAEWETVEPRTGTPKPPQLTAESEAVAPPLDGLAESLEREQIPREREPGEDG